MKILSNKTSVAELSVPNLRIKRLTLKSRGQDRVNALTCEASCCVKTVHTGF
jgi:hypothetical protein